MGHDAAVDKRSKKGRSKRTSNGDNPGTVEIEIGGQKVQARKQTVQTGAGSVSRFFRNLVE
jgi:hypothetical protein